MIYGDPPAIRPDFELFRVQFFDLGVEVREIFDRPLQVREIGFEI